MEKEHPLMKMALSKIDEYARVTDTLINDIEESYTYAVFTFDFEFLQVLKNKAQDALVKLQAYCEEQDKRYQRLINALNKFGEYDDSETLVMLWDLKRPIVYRIQRLDELIQSINKVFT